MARRSADLSIVVLGLGCVFLLRWHSRQVGLIYPDGYQYLLMARGIAQHLTPTVTLGAGGWAFSPNIDAALKPLFPALVAVGSFIAPAQAAASAVTALSAAATVVLTGVLAVRLTGSRPAGVLCALGVLLSPTVVRFSSFAGPDPLGCALALGSAVAVSYRRPVLAGILGGLAAAARPEWGVALCAFGLASLVWRDTRPLAARALLGGAFTLAALTAGLRPPLSWPSGGPAGLSGLLAGAVLLQLAARSLARSARSALSGAAILVGGAALTAMLTARGHALGLLVTGQWPLIVLAAAGTVCACRDGQARPVLMLLAAAAVPATAYAYRNPGLERYMAQLVPVVCVLGSFALAAALRLRRPVRRTALVALAGAAFLSLLLAPKPAAPGRDTFEVLARALSQAPAGPLVSAAPDAYGVLLTDRPERMLAPGVRGLVLIDGAARFYAPTLSVRGRLLATLQVPDGFVHPDGSTDPLPARLYDGVVVRR